MRLNRQNFKGYTWMRCEEGNVHSCFLLCTFPASLLILASIAAETFRWSPGSSPRCCSLLRCWAFSYTCLSSGEPRVIINIVNQDSQPPVEAWVFGMYVPSGYLYWWVMSCLSSEPTALVLMKRPTDFVEPPNLTIFPSESRIRSTTSALTWGDAMQKYRTGPWFIWRYN